MPSENGPGPKKAASAEEASGHRERLRKRFIEAGPDALADYELLELVLFLAIPRQDTKTVAKRLISRFGTYAEVMRAPAAALQEVAGVGRAGAVAVHSVAAAAVRLAQREVMDRPVLSSWNQLLDYLHMAMAHAAQEQLRVLYLDTKNRLIDDVLQQEGTINHTAVYPREVIRLALERGAAAIILAHNHPSGDPTPSRADIEMTKEIGNAAKLLGITLHDHVVIARSGHASFKSLGLL